MNMSSQIIHQLSFALKKSVGIYEQKHQIMLKDSHAMKDANTTQDLQSNQRLLQSDSSSIPANNSSRHQSESTSQMESKRCMKQKEGFHQYQHSHKKIKNISHEKQMENSNIWHLPEQIFQEQSVQKENQRLNLYIKKMMLENRKHCEQIFKLMESEFGAQLQIQQSYIVKKVHEESNSIKDDLEKENQTLKNILLQILGKLKVFYNICRTEQGKYHRINGKFQIQQIQKNRQMMEQLSKFQIENRELKKKLYIFKQNGGHYQHQQDTDGMFLFFTEETQKMKKSLQSQANLRKKLQNQNIQLNKRIPLIMDELANLSTKVTSLHQLQNQYDKLKAQNQIIISERQSLKAKTNELDEENDELWERLKNLDKKCIMRRDKYQQNIEQIIDKYQKQINKIMEIVGQGHFNEQIRLLKEEVERLGKLLIHRNQAIQRLQQRLRQKQQKLAQQQKQNDQLLKQVKLAVGQTNINEEGNYLQKLKNKVKCDTNVENIQDIKKLIEQNQEKQKEIKRLISENKAYIAEIQQSKTKSFSDLAEIKQSNLELKQAIEQECKNTEQVNIQYIELQEQYRTLTHKNKKLESVIAQLHHEFQKLKECIIKLKEERGTILANNKQLRESYQQLMKNTQRPKHNSIAAKN